jgi:indole-3-glycerol phosphate synthase
LQAVADSVTIPVLRKDFIVDPYQIFEARAWGAAAVLLIAAALPPAEFAALAKLAGELELAVLAEVHDREELDWVLTCGVEIVGINARDLRTFKTDLAVAESLLQALPPGIVGVAESAIRDRADLRRLQAAGAGAFLIGETLMRADHPGAKLAELLG